MPVSKKNPMGRIGRVALRKAERHPADIASPEILSFTVKAMLAHYIPIKQVSKKDRKVLLEVSNIFRQTLYENQDLRKMIDEYCWVNKIDMEQRARLAGILERAKLSVIQAGDKGILTRGLEKEEGVMIARSLYFIKIRVPELITALRRQ